MDFGDDMDLEWMYKSFRRRAGLKCKSFDFYVDDAICYILSYTRRGIGEWKEAFEPIAVRLAVIDYNRAGAEGVHSRSEGGVSTTFLDAQDYPESVTCALNAYRLIKGGGVR